MSKRPPYIEAAVTILVLVFLALVVVGGIDTGTETPTSAIARLP
jgi:hypothetical protein